MVYVSTRLIASSYFQQVTRLQDQKKKTSHPFAIIFKVN